MFENLGAFELILFLFVGLPSILWVIGLMDILISNFQGYDKIIMETCFGRKEKLVIFISGFPIR